MKKSAVMLPLVALALTACSTSNPEVPPAEVVSVPAPAWQNQEIQPVQMPNTMTQPVYQAVQQVQQQLPQPSYQAPLPPVYPAPQPPVYTAPQPQVQMPTQPQVQAPAPTVAHGQSYQIGNCRIVRDAMNAPQYKQMQKGCYTDATYTVNKGDTIFFVAFLAGKPHEDIARLNQLAAPYALKMGQVLRLR